MTSPINRIEKVLKTKEDLQSFVLIAFVLFILFVKCYMIIVNLKTANAVGTQRNAEIVKTHANPNS